MHVHVFVDLTHRLFEMTREEIRDVNIHMHVLSTYVYRYM